ncbi:MAG: type III-A CRISPR-associated RAMP protein Csm5 [Anaerobutyricum sp.]|nr:type III-A CRISPR-associated RAMP protein Csm5 [Anaerobutyricum sp.]
MNSYLKEYILEIKVLAPVFIGSGKTIGKKEYLYDRRANKVTLFNMKKLYQGLNRLRLLPNYEKFLMSDRGDLFNFFKDYNITRKEYESWIQYEAKMGDKGLITKNTHDIQTFIKDPYGLPYVPGSSLKGALRTIIQCGFYLQNPNQAKKMAQQVKNAPMERRNRYLIKEDRQMDVDSVHRPLHNDTNISNQVNDMLKGLIVGDSVPIAKENLCVCQKIDLLVNGQTKPMPLLRECIQPGVTIQFPITMDTSVCKITGREILERIRQFYKNYQTEFMSKFKKAPKTLGNSTTFFLGGGAGYVSKTCSYAIMHGTDAVGTVGKIINATLPPKVQKQHGHFDDRKKGVSPHTLKITRYDGREKQMGAVCVTKFKSLSAAAPK